MPARITTTSMKSGRNSPAGRSVSASCVANSNTVSSDAPKAMRALGVPGCVIRDRRFGAGFDSSVIRYTGGGARAASFCEPAEEAVLVPLRACGVVGNALHELQNDPIEQRGGGRVDVLVQVVGRLVVDVTHPILANLLFGRAGRVSKFEGKRRHAVADETVLVATDEAVLFGLIIGLDFHAEFLGGGAHRVAEGGFAEALHFEILERIERQEHVEIDIGDDLVGWYGGMGGEVARPEFALLLGCDRQKYDGALGPRSRRFQDARDLQHGCDAGGVIHRAVVDAVALDGAADTQMVEVSGEDYVFVLEFAVGAGEQAGDVGRLERITLDGGLGVEQGRERKLGERLIFPSQLLNLFEGVSAAGEELFRTARIDGDGDLLSLSLLQGRVGEDDGGLSRSAPAASAAARAASGRWGCGSGGIGCGPGAGRIV